MSIYRGGIGQWSWVLHRLTGVGVLVFLIFHILDTALIMLGPELYNKIIGIYRMPFFGLMDIGLFAAVLYHSLNGVRISVIDFWPASTRYHKEMFGIVLGLFFIIFLPVAWIMLGHILHAGAG
jgi:succinate dehydrogenase / fumarate reductase cytochrome b subunit